jgi:hypothetical protein
VTTRGQGSEAGNSGDQRKCVCMHVHMCTDMQAEWRAEKASVTDAIVSLGGGGGALMCIAHSIFPCRFEIFVVGWGW